jgi:hypothetical protein
MTATFMVIGAATMIVALGAVSLWRTLSPDSRDGLQPKERLVNLKAALVADPPAPDGATLLNRTEYAGDNLSDGPSIGWEYQFGGTASEFVEHYRLVLENKGWQMEQPGNLPGQLMNFGIVENGTHYTIALFGPGSTPNYRVSAFG